jgi:cytochrome o ubiquinol oxidase operon protein cyoD
MARQQSYRAQQLRYVIGFLWATILTVGAYLLTVYGAQTDKTAAVIVILVLAALQTAAHAYFFLHLGEEGKPRWKSFSFAYTIAMVLVIIVGSLWVVQNMNYNMGMSGAEMEHSLLEQNKKGF